MEAGSHPKKIRVMPSERMFASKKRFQNDEPFTLRGVNGGEDGLIN